MMVAPFRRYLRMLAALAFSKVPFRSRINCRTISLLRYPGLQALESFEAIDERKGCLAEFSASDVDCSDAMCLASYIAADAEHLIADERQLFVHVELAGSFYLMPCIRLQAFYEFFCFLNLLLFFKNTCASDLIFFFGPARFVLDISCFLDFTNGHISNTLNLLEVFFIVNLLTYLNYTGRFFPYLVVPSSCSALVR